MAAYMGWVTHQNNLLASASLSATSSASGYGVANTIALPITATWRSTSVATAQDIDIDLVSTSVPVDTLGLVNHNLTAGCVIEVFAGTSTARSNFYASILYRDKLAFAKLAAAQTYRYWRIRLTDTGNSFGYLQLGYLLFGVLVAPAFNFRTSWTTARDYRNMEMPSNYGVVSTGQVDSTTTLNLSFAQLSASNMTTLRDLYIAQKKNVYPLLFLPERDGSDAYFVRFNEDFVEKLMASYRYTDLSLVEDSYGKRF